MVSSPGSPVPIRHRPPPKRTYGRRGVRAFKARAVTPEIASDTDVESEEDHSLVTPTASNARSSSDSRSKRARISKGGEDEEAKVASRPTTPRNDSGSQSNALSNSPSAATAESPSDPSSSRTPRPATRLRSDLSAEGSSLSFAPGSPDTSQRNAGASRQGSHPPRAKRRMLSRAESMNNTVTQSTIPSGPSTPRPLKTTASMPMTPGSARSLKSLASLAELQSPGAGGSQTGSPTVTALVPVAMGSPSPVRMAKRTYGGSRSFLANAPTDLETALNEDAQPSYSELRKAYEVDNGDDDAIRNLAEEFNLARAPEPINDMRSKGENRLFMDDIGVLLGDIKNPGQSLALKRSSALDVLQKMQESQWMARLRGHTENVFADLCSARGDDPILGAACLLFLALLAKGNGLRKILEGEVDNVIPILQSHISLSTGPLDHGFKGKVSLSVQRLRTISAKIFDQQPTGGSRGIASFVIAEGYQDSSTTQQFQAGIAHEEIALSLFHQLKNDGDILHARMELYRNGIDLLPSDGVVNLDATEQSLRALSRIVAVSLPEREQLSHDRESIIALLHLLVSMVATAVDEEEQGATKRQGARCSVLCMQVLAPLADPARMAEGAREAFESAHEDEAIFTAFGRLMAQRNKWPALCKLRSTSRSPSPSPSKDEGEEEEEHTDVIENLEATELLIFMSPVLDRILPTTRTAAINVATTSVSDCGKRACISGCRCLSSISFASLVVALYNEYEGAADSSQQILEGETSVRKTDEQGGRALLLSMFLTVLLTRLLVAAPAHVRPLVQRDLPTTVSGGGWKTRLQGLQERLTHFRSVYAKVREHVGASLEGAEPDQDGGESMLDEALRELQPLVEAADE